LKVPTLIITDLDIKRSPKEKDDFTQVTSLHDRNTTNATIKKYYKSDSTLKDIPEKIENENFRIAYQGKIHGFYATSFEEAFILTNYRNTILKKTIEWLKPTIVKNIIGEEKDIEQIKENSYQLQRKLSSSKSDFANKLLYESITIDDNIERPILPTYILDGLNWLTKKLNGGIK